MDKENVKLVIRGILQDQGRVHTQLAWVIKESAGE